MLSPSFPSTPPNIFVTVGSTSFSPLISRILSPTVLSLFPPYSNLVIQYGRSDLATILAGDGHGDGDGDGDAAKNSSSSPDQYSAFQPEAGLRKLQAGGYSWRGSTVKQELDAGFTGSIHGWQLVEGTRGDKGGGETGLPITRRGDSSSSSSSSSSRKNDTRARERRTGSTRQTDAGLDHIPTSPASVSSSPTLASSPSAFSASSDEDDEDEDEEWPTSSERLKGRATIYSHPRLLTFKTSSPTNLSITLMAYVPSLLPYLQRADLVISHAGSGTLLDTLRSSQSSSADDDDDDPPPPPLLLLVPNESLMDNHQVDLARAVRQGGWARSASLHPSSSSLSSSSTFDLPFASLEEEVSILISSWRHRRQDKGQVQGVAQGQAQSIWLPEPFPPAEPQRFRWLVDEEMGFL